MEGTLPLVSQKGHKDLYEPLLASLFVFTSFFHIVFLASEITSDIPPVLPPSSLQSRWASREGTEGDEAESPLF